MWLRLSEDYSDSLQILSANRSIIRESCPAYPPQHCYKFENVHQCPASLYQNDCLLTLQVTLPTTSPSWSISHYKFDDAHQHCPLHKWSLKIINDLPCVPLYICNPLGQTLLRNKQSHQRHTNRPRSASLKVTRQHPYNQTLIVIRAMHLHTRSTRHKVSSYGLYTHTSRSIDTNSSRYASALCSKSTMTPLSVILKLCTYLSLFQ